ncbi:MAG: hypothetical protein R3F11_08760 [Verrucomicrobiales bacterium]
MVPIDDYLPDEVVSYVHAAPGEGNFDAAYGETAEGLPAAWGEVDLTSRAQVAADLDLLLAPIGFRSQTAASLVFNGTAFLLVARRLRRWCFVLMKRSPMVRVPI